MHLSLFMASKEPPPPKRFWEHLALDSHYRFLVQTGWRPLALEDRGLVDRQQVAWLWAKRGRLSVHAASCSRV